MWVKGNDFTNVLLGSKVMVKTWIRTELSQGNVGAKAPQITQNGRYRHLGHVIT